jgi:hypothetical protein
MHHFRRQARLKTTAGDHVDLAAQYRLKVEPQPCQIEKRPARLEIDQEVDVGVVTLIAASNRSEDTNIVGAAPFSRRDDLAAISRADFLQRHRWCLRVCHTATR